MALGIKPTVDFAFKKIFGSPENVRALIGLLNAILELPAPITDVEILNPFSYQEFVGDKQIILDVRARDSTGRMAEYRNAGIIVSGLTQRLVYYACSLYVDQLESGRRLRILETGHIDLPAQHDLFSRRRTSPTTDSGCAIRSKAESLAIWWRYTRSSCRSII